LKLLRRNFYHTVINFFFILKRKEINKWFFRSTTNKNVLLVQLKSVTNHMSNGCSSQTSANCNDWFFTIFISKSKVGINFAAMIFCHFQLRKVWINRRRINNKISLNKVFVFMLTESHRWCRDNLFQTLHLFIQIEDRLNIRHSDLTSPLSKKINQSKSRFTETNNQDFFPFIFFHVISLNYLSFNVARAMMARTRLTIQNLTITFVSGHPSSSK